MPAIRTYRVTETRQVSVVATSPAEAMQQGDRIFRGLDENPKPDGQGSVMTGPVRVTDCAVSEE